jgi:hypothetical protein
MRNYVRRSIDRLVEWGVSTVTDCNEIVAAASRFLESGREIAVAGEGERLVLGQVFAFRPDATPLGVWMQRCIAQALRDNGLWCEDATLGVELDYGADWPDGEESPSWPAVGQFVVWADRSLFAGRAVGTAYQVEPAPGDYEAYDAYVEVPLLTIHLTKVGDRAALPPDTDEFLDEEPEETGGYGWCIVVLVVLVLVTVFAVVGIVATVMWLAARF